MLDKLLENAALFADSNGIPALPKQNKDVFKHLSKCVGVYCVDNITGTPISE